MSNLPQIPASNPSWIATGVVLKDLNFADKIIGIPDLKQKAALLHAVKRDSQFLRGLRVMDYSLCLGVHYCGNGSYPDVDCITADDGISSSLAVLKGYEPKYQCTLLRTDAAQKVGGPSDRLKASRRRVLSPTGSPNMNVHFETLKEFLDLQDHMD